MKRWSFFVYGVFCYLLFLATFACMAGFVSNLFGPWSLDTPGTSSVGWALLVNLGLISLFGVQHSIMARPWFKSLWTRVIPQPIERSTYVLFSSVISFLMMWQWQGMETVIWDVQQPILRGLLWGLFVVGWLMVPTASLMISHFDLFGTRQVWLYLKGRPYTALPFRTPLLYNRVRHPLYVGWTLAFWATPTMTLSHLVFAGTLTLYMGIAAIFEERDLTSYFGEVYRAYQRRVPRFIPRLGGGPAELPATSAVRTEPSSL